MGEVYFPGKIEMEMEMQMEMGLHWLDEMGSKSQLGSQMARWPAVRVRTS